MKVQIRVPEPGSKVKVRSPRAGYREKGTFRVLGANVHNGTTYIDVEHERSGRRRVFTAERLKVLRGPRKKAA